MINFHKKLEIKIFILAILMAIASNTLAELKVGDIAPSFKLTDQFNVQHTLNNYHGKWVVLYFYPKDDTPGCTTQACDFRDATERIIASKAVVFGISVDSLESHVKFAEKYSIPFSILSDPAGDVSIKYDSLSGFFVVSKRNTFIIDPQGKIAKKFYSVKPKGHAEMILNELNLLQSKYQ